MILLFSDLLDLQQEGHEVDHQVKFGYRSGSAEHLVDEVGIATAWV